MEQMGSLPTVVHTEHPVTDVVMKICSWHMVQLPSARYISCSRLDYNNSLLQAIQKIDSQSLDAYVPEKQIGKKDPALLYYHQHNPEMFRGGLLGVLLIRFICVLYC